MGDRGQGPRFIPGRAPGARDRSPAGQRAPRDDQGRRRPGASGYDRRGLPDDFDGRPRSSGEFLVSGGVRSGGPPDGLDGLRSGGRLRWLGAMSMPRAVLVLAGATLIGIVLTVMAGTEPGNLLGGFIIAGLLVAVLGVRRGAVYLFFPVPALAFFVAAVAAGFVHDRKMVSSTAGLAAAFPQWVAGIFWPAVVATVLVLLAGGGRWLLKTPLVTSQSPLPAGPRGAPGNARTSQGFRRPADEWADDQSDGDSAPRSRTGPASRYDTGPTPRQGTGPSPRPDTGPTPRQGTGPTPRQGTGPTPRQGTGPTPRQGTGPTPRQGTGPTPQQSTGPTPQQGGGTWRGGANGSRPGRPARDPRTDRDPWGDPRLPPDRSQPTGPRPQANGRPVAQPRPGQIGPGPSFSPAPAPPRRQPPDGWTR